MILGLWQLLFKFSYFDIEVDVKVLKQALGVSIIKTHFEKIYILKIYVELNVWSNT